MNAWYFIVALVLTVWHWVIHALIVLGQLSIAVLVVGTGIWAVRKLW